MGNTWRAVSPPPGKDRSATRWPEERGQGTGPPSSTPRDNLTSLEAEVGDGGRNLEDFKLGVRPDRGSGDTVLEYM